MLRITLSKNRIEIQFECFFLDIQINKKVGRHTNIYYCIKESFQNQIKKKSFIFYQFLCRYLSIDPTFQKGKFIHILDFGEEKNIICLCVSMNTNISL